LGAVYKIPMVKADFSQFDEKEVLINSWIQKKLNHKVFVYTSKFFHYLLLEKNLILLGMLLFCSGLWANQLLVIAQVVALEHFPLLVSKLWFGRPRPVWLHQHIQLKSLVSGTQVDASFPSGHSAFLTLLAMVSIYEGSNQFATSVQCLLVALAIVGGIGRVHVGAHYLSDVVGGCVYAIAFVAIFYGMGGDELLLERKGSTDLDFQKRFSLVLVSLQILIVVLTETFVPPKTPLERETYLQNNLSRIPKAKEDEDEDAASLYENVVDRPAGSSRDFLAPFIGLSAVVFWTEPMIASIYVQSRALPYFEISGSVRFFGVLTGLGFIAAFVLPARKVVGHKFKHMHILRLMLLAVIYVLLMIFAAIFCHFALQALTELIEDE